MTNIVGKIEINGKFLGNGVLISQDIVLTAKHVLLNIDDMQTENISEKTVNFITDSIEKIKGTTVNIEQSKNSNDDYAFIQLNMMLAEEPFFNLCAPKNEIVGMKCIINGFYPLSNKKITLTGSIRSSSDDGITINIDDNNQLQDYSGLSGSPVYISQFLVGIVKEQNYQNIEVLPIKKIVEALNNLDIKVLDNTIKDFSDEASKIIMIKTQEAIHAAGPRYNGELNVQTKTFEHLMYLLNKKSVSDYLHDLYNLIRECGKAFNQIEENIINKTDLVLENNKKIISTINEKISKDVERLDNSEDIFSSLIELLKEYNDYEKQLNAVLFEEIERFEEKNGKGTFKNKKWRGFQASYLCRIPTRYLDDLKEAISSIKKIEEKARLNKINEFGNKAILVTGKGGSGKTHLLCDIANFLVLKGAPAILNFGNWFAEPESFSSSFLKKFDVFNNIDELLEYIDYVGSSQDYFIPICIDAINETDNNNYWNIVLPQFISKLQKYKNIKLIISCRTIYRDEYLNDEITEALLKINHNGFENCQVEAIDAFNDFYGVKVTFNSINFSEFVNPLMLKMLCEIAQEHPDKTASYSDIHSLMNEYMDIKNKKITSSYTNSLSVRDKMVHGCMNAIAECMTTNNRYSLKWNEVHDVVSKVLKQWNLQENTSGVIKQLISENLLREYDNDNTEISFGYQRYYDVLYAEMLIGENYDTLVSKISKDEITHGTLEMLQILYKRKYEHEMIFSISGCNNDKLLTTFLHGLYWREASDFSDETTRAILYLIKSNDFDTVEMTVFSLLNVCTKLDCPLNAMFIHKHLARFDRLKRNYFLSCFLLKRYDEIKSISNLCENAIMLDNKTLDREVVFLWKITLCWETSLNDCKLRDKASKGLTNLFVIYPEDYERIYKMFQDIDDDYIHERLWQSIYSSLVLRNDKENTFVVMNIIKKEILDKNQFPQNVLIRDYLRSIFEYAYANGWCDKNTVEKLRPPYASPIHSVNMNLVNENKKLEEELYWNCTESDFGKYTISHAVLNYGLTQKDMGNLIFEDIIACSYPSSDCKIYDQYIDQTYGSLRSRDEEVERIGKKLQKIYLYREMGMLYDNYPYSPKYGDEEKNVVAPMQGSNFRYIDLMRMPRKNSFLGNEFKYPFSRYSKWDNCDWFKYDDIEEYAYPLLTYNANGFGESFIMQGYFTSNGPLKDRNYREVWMQIRSYMFKKEDKENLLKWLKGKNFAGRWMPEGFNGIYDICLGEHPWCPTMQNYIEEYENEQDEVKYGSNIKIPFKIIPTADDYLSEKDSPFFEGMYDSFMFPSDFWYKKTNVRWDGKYGYNVDGKKVFNNAVNNAIYVDKSFLLNFIKNSDYEIIWTILGEKQILGGFGSNYPGRSEFSLSFFLNENMEIENNDYLYVTDTPKK